MGKTKAEEYEALSQIRGILKDKPDFDELIHSDEEG